MVQLHLVIRQSISITVTKLQSVLTADVSALAVHFVPHPTDTFLQPLEGWSNTRVVEHHGDWFFEGPNGLDAFGQDYRPKYRKVISSMPSINLELNDVRPAGSDPLVWYTCTPDVAWL